MATKTDEECPVRVFLDRLVRGCFRYQLLILLLAGLIFLGIGAWGFAVMSNGEATGISSLIYRSLQLFALQSGDVEPIPWQINLVRFAAPILAAYALTLIFVKIFWDSFQDFFLLRLHIKPHVIICGFGYLGPFYMKKLRNRGYLTIIVEKDNTNPAIRGYGPLNPRLIFGDATDEGILKRASLDTAQGLIAVTGDDLVNIKIGMTAWKMLSPDRGAKDTSLKDLVPGENVPCFLLHLEDRWLGSALSGRLAQLKPPVRAKVHPFNMYFIAARRLADYVWETRIQGRIDPLRVPHILIIGFGTLGEEFGRSLSHHLIRAHASAIITIMDIKDVQDKCRRMTQWIEQRYSGEQATHGIIDQGGFHRYEWKDQGNGDRHFLTFIPRETKIPSKTFREGSFLNPDSGSLSAAVICLADEALSMTAGLELSNVIEREGTNVPIFIRLTQKDGTMAFVRAVNKTTHYENLIPYSVVECGGLWNEELDARYPPKPCLLRRICTREGCERQ